MRIEQQIPDTAQFSHEFDHPAADTLLLEYLDSTYQPTGTPRVRGNIVLSANSSLSDDHGVSAGISSVLDRQILRLIRRFADVVIHGASTLRAEGLIIPKTAMLAIMTRTADFTLPDHPLAAERVLLFCSEKAVERCVAQHRKSVAGIFSVPDEISAASVSVVSQLLRLRYQQLVCEGGAQVLDAFLDANLLDELAVTHSPVHSSRIVALRKWPQPQYQLVHQFRTSDAFLFQRWINPHAITTQLNEDTATTS